MVSQKELYNNNAMTMKEDVEKFIKKRFDIDCHWLDGNCYYLALILCHRFPGLYKIYFPIEGHWKATDGEYGYDYTGAKKIDLDSDIFYTEDFLTNSDLDLYKEIIEDCTR